MPKNCANCAAAIDADAVFCMTCGKPILQIVHCPKCGGALDSQARFCKYCAFDLSQPIQTAATAPPPQTAEAARLKQENIQKNIPFAATQAVAQNKTGTRHEEKVAPDNPASLISPSGAALAVICFFLPWLQWSACGIKKTATGADFATFDGSFWFFPLMGITSVAAYFIAKGQRQIWKARPFIVLSSGFALFLLFYKVSSVSGSTDFMGQRISASSLGFEPQFGAFGTIVGFVLAIFGCVFMGRKVLNASSPPVDFQNTANVYSNAAKDFESAAASLKPNVAAMLCYVSPLVLTYVLGALLGGGGALAIVVSLAAAVVAQVVFLKLEPHDKNSLVRFHAFQSIFLIAACYAVNLLVAGLFITLAKSFDAFALMSLAAYAALALVVAELIVFIFTAGKAYKAQVYKLPFVGDFAAKYAGVSAAENYADSVSPSFTTPPFFQARNEPRFTETASAPATKTYDVSPPENYSENYDDASPLIPMMPEDAYFAPANFNETAAIQNERAENLGTFDYSHPPAPKKDYFFFYIAGGVVFSFFAVAGAVVLFILYVNSNLAASSQSASNAAATNASVKISAPSPSPPATLAATSATNAAANSFQENPVETGTSDPSSAPDKPSFTSSIVGREGVLTTNTNIRSASNKNASSVGIHFRGARVRVSNVEYYDTADGLSTWYKIQILEYGCDMTGNLGCGKNSETDLDEGWINAKFVRLN